MRKVKADEYVDLYELINPDKGKMSIELSNSGSRPELNLVPKPSKSLGPVQWRKAFRKYMIAYVGEHPTLAPDILLYYDNMVEKMDDPISTGELWIGTSENRERP